MKKVSLFSFLILGLVLGVTLAPHLVSAQVVTQDGCYGWNAYSVTTGQKCSYENSSLPDGCTSTNH